MRVFSCGIDDFDCGADAPVCVGDEELSLLLESEESIFRSTSTGFCLIAFCFATAAFDFVVVGVVPTLILLFALVCKKRRC